MRSAELKILATLLTTTALTLALTTSLMARIGPFPSGTGGVAIPPPVGNYPAKSMGYGGCSNTKGIINAYPAASTRGIFWPGYLTDDGYIEAWTDDSGNQIPGTGAGSTPANSLPANFYKFWAKFDQQRRTSNPIGGQQLLAVWFQLCESEFAIFHGVAPGTNAMIDTIATLLRKHTTGCLTTPSDCGETVAPNISPNLKVFFSMINSFKTTSICYLMNSSGVGGISGGNSLVNGQINAGATTGTFSSVAGLAATGDKSKFTWLLDDGSQVNETISNISGLVVTFAPAIPAARNVPDQTRAYGGDGKGETNTYSFMQHAIGAAYPGFTSVTYGPNGSGQTDPLFPTLASQDGAFYPLGPLLPSDTITDGCHPPPSTGGAKLATQLANFADSQVQ